MQTCDTVVKCPTPPLTLCRRVTPKYNQVATLYTVWTTPSVTLAKNSSAYTHGEVVRGRSFKHFKNFCSTRKVLDVLPLCHKFAYKPWMVVQGQGLLAQRL